MRKKILCFVLATTMVISATGCNAKKKVDVLKNKVKEQVEEQVEKAEINKKFKEVDGKLEVYLPTHYTYTSEQLDYEGNLQYDNRGLLLEDKIYREEYDELYDEENQTDEYVSSYEYNEDYKLLNENHKDDHRFSTIGKIEYYYDDKGRLLKEKSSTDQTKLEEMTDIAEDNVTYFDETEYDSKTSLPIKEEEYSVGSSEDESISCNISYQYDEKGYITYVREKKKIGNSFEIRETKIKYDSEGNVIQRNSDNSAYEDGDEYMAEYDKDGYIVKTNIFDDNFLKEEYSDGNLQIVYNAQHKPEKMNRGVYHYYYEYSNDLISEISVTNDNDEIEKEFILQYDENNNLIEISDTENGTKMSIEYDKFYVDKKNFDYYLGHYFYEYRNIPLNDRNSMEVNMWEPYYITEINHDIFQDNLLWELCALPKVSLEEYYAGNPLKPDNK